MPATFSRTSASLGGGCSGAGDGDGTAGADCGTGAAFFGAASSFVDLALAQPPVRAAPAATKQPSSSAPVLVLIIYEYPAGNPTSPAGLCRNDRRLQRIEESNQ